jgi:NADPH:quinone reductase-like Zn-dependent oxidoreductase
MKAVRIHSFGGSDLLVYEDAPQPKPGENDVLIRVHASAVNPVDMAFRAGYMNSFMPIPFPITLGCDVAGEVVDVGSGVRGFKKGDAVFARTDLFRLGGYAEYAAVSASEVAMKPAGLDFIQAAGLPHAGLTAWRSLDAGNLSMGKRVLVHGGAGGVGTLAVQLAKVRGVNVTTTSSTKNLDFLRQLGADQAVDYTAGPFEAAVQGMDFVLDTIGGDTQERSWQTLKPGGVLASTVQTPSAEKAAAHGASGVMAAGMPPAGPVLMEIAKLVEAGKVKAVIAAVLPLADARRGQDIVDEHHTRGKIILQVI